MEKFILLTIMTVMLVVMVLVTGDSRASCVHQMVAGGSKWCTVEGE